MKFTLLSRLRGIILAAVTLTDAEGQSVPQLINYQGQLLQADGTPVPTSDRTLTFRIFATESAEGEPVWGPQELPSVPIVRGHFNVLLGPADSQSRPIMTAFEGSPRFVEIQFGNETIRPRQQILSAPYAMRAEVATRALSSDNALNAGKLAGQDWTSLLVSGNDPSTGFIKAAKLEREGIGAAQIRTRSLSANLLVEKAVTGQEIADGTLTIAHMHQALTNLFDSLCPPGTITAFGGAQVPLGWELCDGRSLPANEPKYKRLHEAILSAWGGTVIDGVPHFSLPDLRGMFLRGVDNSPNPGRSTSNRDPDRLTREASSAGGNLGNAVGSVQAEAFKRHAHNIAKAASTTTGGPSEYVRTGFPTTSRDSQFPGLVKPEGGAETRPKNAYVNFIIKY